MGLKRNGKQMPDHAYSNPMINQDYRTADQLAVQHCVLKFCLDNVCLIHTQLVTTFIKFVLTERVPRNHVYCMIDFLGNQMFYAAREAKEGTE